MDDLWNQSEFAARYGRRLAILVPYRDRAQHLASFVPHVTSYFRQDKLDRNISVSIHIVEQAGNAPFNRGQILNCGYLLVRDTADYVCFHDVDYLPVWADYSWAPRPARLIWHGLTLREDWNSFFGGVVQFDKASFEQVNGYPNSYWGWGYEDVGLGLRCRLVGLDWERRDGTYHALPHRHAGFTAPGVHSDEARRTAAIFSARQAQIRELMQTEGISNLKFQLIRQEPMRLNGVVVPNAFHHLVELEGLPAVAGGLSNAK